MPLRIGGSLAVVLSFVVSATCVAAAFYSLWWSVSATSMAFVECSGTYSLSAESFRCKWPVILGIAFWALLALAAAALLTGFVIASRPASNGQHGGI